MFLAFLSNSTECWDSNLKQTFSSQSFTIIQETKHLKVHSLYCSASLWQLTVEVQFLWVSILWYPCGCAKSLWKQLIIGAIVQIYILSCHQEESQTQIISHHENTKTEVHWDLILSTVKIMPQPHPKLGTFWIQIQWIPPGQLTMTVYSYPTILVESNG